MDVVIARLSHETNTFAPVTERGAFFDDIAGTGAEAFVEQCRERGLRHSVCFVATANPSGPVEHAVFEENASRVVAAVQQQQPRAVLLDLHGAMVTTQLEDAEGELLRRVREAAPEAVVGVCLDLHGNVTPAMVAHADVMACFQTYPHVDMRETGARVARLVFEQLLGEGKRQRFEKAFVSIDALASTLCSRTDVDGPMLRAVKAAMHLEATGAIVSGSVFAGFPLSDTHCTGLSVVCYGREAGRVKRVAHELADQIANARESFVFWPEPVERSMREVASQLSKQREAERYVLLLDHADNVMSGGAASSLAVLQLLLSQSWRFLCGPLCLPALAGSCALGQSGSFDLGGGVVITGR
jgi:microcystin degradation protein MlrC